MDGEKLEFFTSSPSFPFPRISWLTDRLNYWIRALLFGPPKKRVNTDETWSERTKPI